MCSLLDLVGTDVAALNCMRFELKVKGLTSPMLTDLYDTTAHVLYELKGNMDRDAVRLAIGQLMDYRRHVNSPNPALAVLLPEERHDDRS